MRLVAMHAAARLALHAALVALPLVALPPQPSLAANDMLAPPQWVTTENGVMLKRQSDENTKLESKAAKARARPGSRARDARADESTQFLDDSLLKNAEEKFTLIAEELAPNYAYAYTNRANVRIARGNYAGAVADYERALQLAPLATDAWVTYLNRGSTLLSMDGRAARRSSDLDTSVSLSEGRSLHAARARLGVPRAR